ncbi:HAMP domain-containing histidine kinase [Vagococcus sp. BWB3-3]|uniref:histidine kinase n=1 Tax=Vagococcus allomyrinae TaxID=2794353 RepID=A0A940PDT4_9ENTE|nr:HAMP domain-containing sensor histidine kinase [Vagococcus allomyrinae]MBP1043074.1 HAMP domain-containing histidine kinase [Vagococcus allomyrinae]
MKEKKSRFSLTVGLVFFVFFMMISCFIIIGGVVLILAKTKLIAFVPRFSHQYRFFGPFIIIFIFSILMGTMLTALFSHKMLHPFKRAINAINQVANGDLETTLHYERAPYELIELSHSFNRMTKELSGIETLRSDFINHFSHEFKTPIVSIQGFAKLLKDPGISEEDRQKYIDIIIQESTRLTSLSTNVLNLSKVETIEILPQKTSIQLAEQLRQVILLLEPKWQIKQITFNLTLAECWLQSSDELLQQLWINLIDNAIKFSPPNSSITVELIDRGQEVMVVISDQGIGMDQATQELVFNKFYQGDNSHAIEGNGLGLSLVKRIVTLCRGQITLTSSPDKGSTFTITLPKK